MALFIIVKTGKIKHEDNISFAYIIKRTRVEHANFLFLGFWMFLHSVKIVEMRRWYLNLGRRHLRRLATIASLACFLSLIAWVIVTDTSFNKQAEGKEPERLLIHNSTEVSYW